MAVITTFDLTLAMISIFFLDEKDGLICDPCELMYEIRDDIPIMLIDEAKPLEK